MATKTINVDMLAKMFLAGAQNIEARKEYINELNVFPVPDGDTGTNMSMTIMSAAKEVTALDHPDMKTLAKAISSPVRTATLFVAAIPVPASPSGGQTGIPACKSPSVSNNFAPASVKTPASSPATSTFGSNSSNFHGNAFASTS